MVSKKLIVILSVILLASVLFYFFGFSKPEANETTVTVARIIDGDTFELGYQKEVTLHSGSGDNTESDLFWKRKYSVWSNTGDTLYLRDGEGNLVLVKSYNK